MGFPILLITAFTKGMPIPLAHAAFVCLTLSVQCFAQTYYVDVHLNSSVDITSPSYPANYPHTANVTWEVRVSSAMPHHDRYILVLVFQDFHLESESNCGYDWVSIEQPTDHLGTSYTTVGQWCGTDYPKTFLASHQTFRIIFRSDVAVAERGFWAKIEFLDTSCKEMSLKYEMTETLNVAEYLLSSEAGLSHYCQSFDTRHTNCNGYGCAIQMDIRQLTSDRDSFCQNEYIALYSGKIIGELERVRFCGNSDFLGSYTIRDTDVTILVLGDVVGQISVTAVADNFIPSCVIDDVHLGFLSLAEIEEAMITIRLQREANSNSSESASCFAMEQRDGYSSKNFYLEWRDLDLASPNVINVSSLPSLENPYPHSNFTLNEQSDMHSKYCISDMDDMVVRYVTYTIDVAETHNNLALYLGDSCEEEATGGYIMAILGGAFGTLVVFFLLHKRRQKQQAAATAPPAPAPTPAPPAARESPPNPESGMPSRHTSNTVVSGTGDESSGGPIEGLPGTDTATSPPAYEFRMNYPLSHTTSPITGPGAPLNIWTTVGPLPASHFPPINDNTQPTILPTEPPPSYSSLDFTGTNVVPSAPSLPSGYIDTLSEDKDIPDSVRDNYV